MNRFILGRNIRLYRALLRLSQASIAKKAGISRCQLSKIENGHSLGNISTLVKICDAIGVGIQDIVSNDFKVIKR